MGFSMYSQNNEEQIILDFYGDKKGRFLDIGANDGISLSCTKRLSELGWGGVCIEPSPSAFVKLQKLYTDNPFIEVVNCAVDNGSAIKTFYHFPDGYISTLSKDFINLWPKHKHSYRKMYLKTITFNEILNVFGCNFDFLKIDVEGIDYKILQAFPFERVNLSAVCIEYCKGNDFDNITNFLSLKGFSKQTVTKQNIVATR